LMFWAESALVLSHCLWPALRKNNVGWSWFELERNGVFI
jgi:hypothetical protein